MTHLLCINIRVDQWEFLQKAKKMEKFNSMSEFFRQLIDLYSKDLIDLINKYELPW